MKSPVYEIEEDTKFVVFWLSAYHASFENFSDLTTAEKFRDQLFKLETEGKTYRGRSVNHVVLSAR